MIALGFDISTSKVAIAGITDQGDIQTHAVHVPAGHVGARRLCVLRSALASSLVASRWQDACIAVIEIPWAAGDSSFALLSATGVVMETVQHAFPGAVVMEVPTPSWKLETIGRGSAPKSDCMAYARIRGYDGDDQDIADALCMAACAWSRWHRELGEAA